MSDTRPEEPHERVRAAPGEATSDALPAPERRRNRIPTDERDRLRCA